MSRLRTFSASILQGTAFGHLETAGARALYQGTAFSRATDAPKRIGLLAPDYGNTNPSRIMSSSRTFFVTTKTSMGRALLQSERNATLFIDVLRSYVAARKFRLHDFVVMPTT